MTTRPTIKFMSGIITAFYKLPGNIVGGSLHIVIDDGNTETEHVQHCLNYARECGDADGMYLAELLLLFTEAERNEILEVSDDQ